MGDESKPARASTAGKYTSTYTPRTALGASALTGAGTAGAAGVASKYTSGYTPGAARTGATYNPGAAAGSTYTPGAAAGSGYTPGAAAGSTYTPGAAAGSGYTPGKYSGYTPRTTLGSSYTSSIGAAGATAPAPAAAAPAAAPAAAAVAAAPATTASSLASKYARPTSAAAAMPAVPAAAPEPTGGDDGAELQEKKRALIEAAAEIRTLKAQLAAGGGGGGDDAKVKALSEEVERLNKDREAASRLIRSKDQAIESLTSRAEAGGGGDGGRAKQLEDEVKALKKEVAASRDSGSAAKNNEVTELKRLVKELEAEKRTLDTEVARLATANARGGGGGGEWDASSEQKEKKYMQAEVQRFKEKLEAADRSAKADAAIREKLQKKVASLEESVRGLGAEQRMRARPGGSFDAVGEGLSGDELYDALQREVGMLRAAAADREMSLAEKDVAIEALVFKADTLERAREADDKRAKQDRLAAKKELAAARAEVDDLQAKAKADLAEAKKENIDLRGKIRMLQKKAADGGKDGGGDGADGEKKGGAGAGGRGAGRGGGGAGRGGKIGDDLEYEVS